MLVLSRKKDESIVINHDITIVVVEIRGDKVRLGIEAPKEVPVHRREVFEAIEATVEPTESTGNESSAAEGPVLQQASPPRDRERADDASISDTAAGALVSAASQPEAGIASASTSAVNEEVSARFAEDDSGEPVSDENGPPAENLRKTRPR